MSVTVLELPRTARQPPPTRAQRHGRAIATLIPFAALGFYAVLRWGTMLQPDPTPRLLGMLGLSLAVAALGLVPAARRRGVAVAVGVIGLIVILPLSGLPLSWTVHVRIAVTIDAIGQGLSGLPNVLVPYEGINPAIRAVIVMGAGVLLLDGAVMMAFAPRSLGELRPAVAALPLIVLAVVPSVLARPGVPYLHGVLLFLLLCAMIWGERIQRLRSAAAVGILALATFGALLAAPVVDPHRALVDFQKLAGRFGAGKGESFNWSQSYGPLQFPREEHQVLQIQARIKSYWKAEDLDAFNGTGWVAQPVADAPPLSDIAPASLKRWTQTLHVTFTGMSSSQVIAAGVAQAPTDIQGDPLPGASNGTWRPETPLRPGSSYLVRVYTPQPSRAQLSHAGTAYPAGIKRGFLSIDLPHFNDPGEGVVGRPVQPLPVSFSPLHASVPFASSDGLGESAMSSLLLASPYGRAYALARQLAAHAATPYAYVLAVERYLGRGYVYDADTPATAYPLDTFLFDTHRGYCQQFAGAMALLLRMGGVPARVSAGFTSGGYQGAGHDYAVTDIDAHAWVEAWFPKYGWVTFDPTPGQDPALGGPLPTPSAAPVTPGSTAGQFPQHRALPTHRRTPKPSSARLRHGGSTGTAARRSGGGIGWPLVAIVLVVAALIAVVARWASLARRALADPVAELERAFARSGRPIAPGTTLAALEHRYRDDPDAAAYIRAIRLERYGADPDPAQAGHRHAGRRALRMQLARGRGVLGRPRALLALPPGPPRRGLKSR